MSDELVGSPTQQQPQQQAAPQAQPEAPNDDQLKNVKSEFDRKLGNVQQNVEALLQANQELQAKLTPQPAPQEEDYDFISNAKQEREKLKQEVRDEWKQEQVKVAESQAAVQSKWNELGQHFPEINMGNSELIVKANEHWGKYSQAEKYKPEVVESVVLRAAMDLGLKPVSQRQEQKQDNFTASAQSASNVAPSKDGELPDSMMQLAQAMGQDVSDPKYLERLKKHSQRKNWTEWS